MGRATPLWIRSAARRRSTSVALALVAVLTVLGAVSGPLLVRAVEEAGLANAVTQAGSDADLLVSTRSQAVSGRDGLVFAVVGAAGAARPLGVFSAPATTLQSADVVRWAARPPSGPGARAGSTGDAVLAARDDGCRDLVLTTGRCVAGDGETVVSSALLTAGKLRLGEKLTTNAPGQVRGTRLTVVGAYDAGRAGRVLAELAANAEGPAIGSRRPMFVTTAAMASYTAPVVIAVRDRPIPGRLDLDAVPAAEAGVNLVRQRVNAAQVGSVSFSTGLPDVLARAAASRRAAATLVFVTTGQSVALALAGAIGVMALIARGRTAEWALGRLRGVRRATSLGIVLAEPVALIGLGTVTGFFGGWAWCGAAVRWVVPGGAPVDPWREPVLVAAAVAGGGLLVAALVASSRSARAPLATLPGQAAEPGRAGRLAVAAESMVVVLAIAAGSQLLLQPTLIGTAGALALLAPGLIAAALVLLAIRVATVLVRRRSRGPTGSIAGLLVGRALARTPSLLQRQVPVAVGVALLVFATQLAGISTRNQHLRAGAEIGAASVLRVAVPPGRDLRTLVRAADPSGRQAMAVQERADSTDSGTSRVVAVDVDRLAAVSAWKSGWAGAGGARLAALLRPTESPEVVLRGSRVRVGLGASTLTRSASALPTDPPAEANLVLVLSPGGAGAWQRVVVGTLDDVGFETLQAKLPCPAGCRLVRWELQPTTPTAFNARLTLTSLSTDQQPASTFAAGLRAPARWRVVIGNPDPGEPPQATVGASAQGLRITAVAHVGDPSVPAVAPADAPDPLPAVVTRGAQADAAPGYPGTVEGVGLDGQPQLLTVVAVASVLPRALDDGVLVDLASASAIADPGQESLVSEVWLAPGSTLGVRRALARDGVRILGVQRLADTEHQLSRETPARAAVADLAVAAAALVLLLILLAGSRVIDAERRATLWAVGLISGLSRRRLALVVATEVFGPAAAATVIGVVAGLSSVALAGSALPLTTPATVAVPLNVRPVAALAVALAVGVLALVALVAAGCAAAEARARPAGGP